MGKEKEKKPPLVMEISKSYCESVSIPFSDNSLRTFKFLTSVKATIEPTSDPEEICEAGDKVFKVAQTLTLNDEVESRSRMGGIDLNSGEAKQVKE